MVVVLDISLCGNGSAASAHNLLCLYLYLLIIHHAYFGFLIT